MRANIPNSEIVFERSSLQLNMILAFHFSIYISLFTLYLSLNSLSLLMVLDGVLVVNKLLDLAKRRKDKCLFFKVDFERAYDTVHWNFLEFMMLGIGFVEGWRRWIRACVFQSSMSVLVNESPTEDFSVGKGLMQGNPLSPFLFLIVAEGLTGLMSKAVDNSLFNGYKVSNSILFHTLLFADNTIIVGEGNLDNLWTIKTMLRSFEIVSGY
jgi:hypothetical protein